MICFLSSHFVASKSKAIKLAQERTKGVVTVLGSIRIKEDVDSSTRSLRAGVCWPRIPARALISRDAAIPAVWRQSAAHHGLSAILEDKSLVSGRIQARLHRPLFRRYSNAIVMLRRQSLWLAENYYH